MKQINIIKQISGMTLQRFFFIITKIIIPSEIQGMAGLVKSITEVAKDDEKNIADLIEEQVQDTVKEQ